MLQQLENQAEMLQAIDRNTERAANAATIAAAFSVMSYLGD